MTTFSAIVDDMVRETKRPDLRGEICSYTNQTIREMHFEPKQGNVVFYQDNYREAQLVSNLDSRFYWDMPNVATFQGGVVVRFDSMYDERGRMLYAKEVHPGPRFEQEPYAFYRVASRFFFGGSRGYGGTNATISISWFEFPPSLKYYAVADRPATYDIESGFAYHDGIVTDEDKEVARNKVTNWLLLRWSSVVEEGIRAKVYKRLSDDSRSRTAYSLYGQLRQGLFTSEVADLGGYV